MTEQRLAKLKNLVESIRKDHSIYDNASPEEKEKLSDAVKEYKSYLESTKPYSEKVADINAQTGPNIQAAAQQAQEESIPDWQKNLFPYSTERSVQKAGGDTQDIAESRSLDEVAGLKDVFSMLGRSIGTTFDEMRQTSENTPSAFAAALKSPVTGATLATAPFTAGLSLVPGMATAAGTSLLAGYGLDENYVTSNAVRDIVSSLLPAFGPYAKFKLTKAGVSQIRNAIIERGLTPTKELVDQVYDGLLRVAGRSVEGVKGSASRVTGQKAGQLASDMDIYALGKGFPKEAGEAAGKAVDYSAGRTRDITAAQAAKARIPQLKADLDYLAEVAKSENGISPDRIRQELQKLLQKYGDIPEALDIISRTLSTSAQGRNKDLFRSALEGGLAKILQRPEAAVPVREALPWSNYVNDLAAASALAEHGTNPPAFAQYLPLSGRVVQAVVSPSVTRAAGSVSVPMGMYLPQVLREIPEDK